TPKWRVTNWSFHRHAAAQATLHQVSRLVPVWLPTYAPWLTPMEKLGHRLRCDVLRGRRLAADGPQRRQQAAAFLDQLVHGSSALRRFGGLIGNGHLACIRSNP